MAAQLFDFYQFTGDRKFLQRLYPVLRGAAEFVLDTLVAAPDGSSSSCPPRRRRTPTSTRDTRSAFASPPVRPIT